jgi:hypothetical protein
MTRLLALLALPALLVGTAAAAGAPLPASVAPASGKERALADDLLFCTSVMNLRSVAPGQTEDEVKKWKDRSRELSSLATVLVPAEELAARTQASVARFDAWKKKESGGKEQVEVSVMKAVLRDCAGKWNANHAWIEERRKSRPQRESQGPERSGGDTGASATATPTTTAGAAITTVSASAAPRQAARPAGRPFLFVFGMGMDRGSDEIATVGFDDGSSETLRANTGFYFSAGVATLRRPAAKVVFDTLATVGIKGWEAGASNGDVSYLAFPLELVERVAYRQARLGAGISYLAGPRISSSGDLSGFGKIDLKNSLGIVVQAEWIGPRPGRAGCSLGGRYVWQKLEEEGGVGIVDANAIGMFVGCEL